ncbi:MAG: universal stress protein [Actinomycetes bacterium]
MARQDEPELDPPVEGGVVVGHDGSQRADVALGAGVEQARLRGLPLHVVHAWKLSTALPETDAPFGTVPSWDECADAVRRSLEAALKRVDTAGVEVHVHVVHGAAANTLLAASRSADLLVVGHRGAGGFAGIVIGSVAEQVARHAACSVLVVRPRG